MQDGHSWLTQNPYIIAFERPVPRSCTQYLVIFCTQIKCRYLQGPFVIWYTYCTTHRDKNNLPPSPLLPPKETKLNNTVLACHPKQTLWAFCHCMAMKTLGNNNKSWVHKNPAHPTQMTKFYSYKQTPFFLPLPPFIMELVLPLRDDISWKEGARIDEHLGATFWQQECHYPSSPPPVLSHITKRQTKARNPQTKIRDVVTIFWEWGQLNKEAKGQCEHSNYGMARGAAAAPNGVQFWWGGTHASLKGSWWSCGDQFIQKGTEGNWANLIWLLQ